jgi:hypothetical protein
MYIYDINSLYPSAMTKTMPVGKPRLIFKEYDNFFGFGEYYIIAPLDISIPFLPYRLNDNNTTKLVFPTGTLLNLNTTLMSIPPNNWVIEFLLYSSLPNEFVFVAFCSLIHSYSRLFFIQSF